MENEVKQRNQRNRRRERAQRMQAQRESKAKDGDSAEDESPAREKPQRPPNRRKKSKEPPFEEDIIDGFAILAFRTYEDLEVRQAIVWSGPNYCHLFGFRYLFCLYIFEHNGKPGHWHTKTEEQETSGAQISGIDF